MRNLIAFFALFVPASFLLMGTPNDCSAQERLALFRAVEKTIEVDSRSRTYLVFSPRRARGLLPLVVMMHGGGGNARQMELYTQFNRIAAREGFIICYPQGVEKNWNDGRGVEFLPAQKEKVDDVKFIREMVAAIGKEFELDKSRIFATGISNGGFMSHRLAADAADLFVGIAPVVGGMPEPISASFEPAKPISIFIIQGDADPLVPYKGGAVGNNPRKPRGIALPTSETIAKYLKANGISGEGKVSMLPDKDTADGVTTQATIYPTGRDGAKVQVYLLKNGGHAWPGTRRYASERMIGKVSQDFHASEEIWKFFATLKR